MRVWAALGAAVIAAAMGSAPALAQNESIFYSPVIEPEFTAPTYFEGLYVGALWGNAGADHGNFYPTGGIDRSGGGAALGWNTYIAPGVVAGVEVQGHVDTDYMGAWSVSAFALGRLGLTTVDNFMVYAVGGAGVFDLVPAYVFGAGWEWGVWDALALRYEILSFIQAAPANGTYIPGVTAWMIRSGAVWHFGEGTTPGFHFTLDRPDNITDFAGHYYGAHYGVIFNPTSNFFPDLGFGAHITRADVGGFVGYNFHLIDGFVVAGVEGTSGILFDTSGDVAFEALGLAKLGVVPLEGLFVYGAAGGGIVQSSLAYALGGGVEYALWGDASLRLEVLALGEQSMPGFTATRATVGAVWHPE